MDKTTVVFVAVGLSMDAFAVAVASGMAMKPIKVPHALRLALFFGGFQAAMPVAGWLAGRGMRDFISGVDHWIAFGLLSAVGAKMIFEAVGANPKRAALDPQSLPMLFALSVATSLDALAVGIGLSFLDVPIIEPAMVIGAITFIFSLAGVYLGGRLGHLFERKIEVLGGLILIAIGLKILAGHLA